jgi:thiamine pyridinylase
VKSPAQILRALVSCHVLTLVALGVVPCAAGEIIIYNVSDRAITCNVDGYTKASGASADAPFRIAPGQKVNIAPSGEAKDHGLNTVECGGLATRAMKITPASTDRVLILNGRQRRVLNALLYSSIPTDPKIGFAPLVQWLTTTYQGFHPDVLLNLVIDPAMDVYDFGKLRTDVFGASGFDTVELDTVFVKWLKDKQLIAPIRITGDEPWPVAKAAILIDGETYGVPSWLCSDFLFSADRSVKDVHDFTTLQPYMAKAAHGSRSLVGDLNGTWTIPAVYIQAFVQSHHGSSAAVAATVPIDEAVFAKLSRFGTYCALSGSDPCIDGTYHSGPDGAVERAYVTEPAANVTGFSERSFVVALYQEKKATLWLVPVPWGDGANSPKLVYSDAFVANRITCSALPCQPDVADFAAIMTSVPVKKYIAMASDLPPGAPSRHVIAATRAFYNDREVRADPIYSQVVAVFLKADLKPYLTSFTPRLQYDLLSGICPALARQNPVWKCIVPQKPD